MLNAPQRGALLLLMPPANRNGQRKSPIELNVEVDPAAAAFAAKDANSTQYSQTVSHPSTDRARYCLILVIGLELVYPMWYGRCQE